MPGYFLDITVPPCKNPSTVVKDVKNAVVSGAKNGKIIWLLKVVGENRVFAFLEDCADAVLDAVNGVAGEFVKVSCTPLRPYENFAHNVNKVDKEICDPSPHKLTPGGTLFFVDVYVHYKGFDEEKIRRVWGAESKMMLGDRKEGKIEIDIFKPVGSKRVLALLNSDADAMDDLAMGVPLVTDLGDNCYFLTSEVTNMLL